MTIKEIKQQKKEMLVRLNEEYKNELIRNLKRFGMYDTIVRRKIDGKTGMFLITNGQFTTHFPKLEFHLLKKDGTPSLNPSGYISTFGDDFLNAVAKDYDPVSEVNDETR